MSVFAYIISSCNLIKRLIHIYSHNSITKTNLMAALEKKKINLSGE